MGISLSLFSTDFNLGSLAIHVGPWRWWYIFSSHSRSVSYTWAPVWAGWYLSSRVTVSTDAFIPDRSPIDKERERERKGQEDSQNEDELETNRCRLFSPMRNTETFTPFYITLVFTYLLVALQPGWVFFY